MKNINSFFAMLFVLAFSISANAQGKYLSTEQTPKEIIAYINRYFPQSKIVIIKQDVDFNDINYEIKLDNHVKLEFFKDFQPKKAKTKGAPIDNVIAKNIREYISKNYSGDTIEEWERKWYGQKVELVTGIELYFDKDGKFLREDR